MQQQNIIKQPTTQAPRILLTHKATHTLSAWLQGQNSNNDADNIKVVVRVRPLFPHEQAKGAASVVDVAEDYSTLKVGASSSSSSRWRRSGGSSVAAGSGSCSSSAAGV
jgi:hypothetical protein